MKMYRQGDILIVEAQRPPAQWERVKRPDNVVAYGEATGHRHEFEGNVALFDVFGQTYADVVEDAELVHDEHETITIPEGFYRIVRQREFDGEHIRQVTD